MERFKERRQFIIPMLMKAANTKFPIKAVMLNISSKGMRVFSNDQRLLLMDEAILKKKTFELEFDFFNIETKGLKAKIVNVTPGKNKGFEKQLGMTFVNPPVDIVKKINMFVQEYTRR